MPIFCLYQPAPTPWCVDLVVPMPEAVEGRLLKHDLPPRDRKRVQDAVNTYYNLYVKFNSDKDLKEEERWAQFAKILKNALDRNLGEHWHVAIGKTLGYACKVRQNAMGVWKFGESRDSGCVVVIWKSPGIEPAVDEGAQEEAKANGGAKPNKSAKAKVSSLGKLVGQVMLVNNQHVMA